MADHCFHENGGITGILHAHGPCGLIAAGTVTSDLVLSGQTYSTTLINSGVGTMPNKTGTHYTPLASAVPIDLGYHNGSQVDGIANCTATNIVVGTTIGGVPGSCIRAIGTADTPQVLEGYTFSNTTGASRPGAMVNRGSVSFSPGNGSSGGSYGAGYYTSVTCGPGPYQTCQLPEVLCEQYGAANCNLTHAYGNATAGTVLEGYTFSSASAGSNGTSGVAGTMSSHGSLTITPSTSAQNFSSGYYAGITASAYSCPAGSITGNADPSVVLEGFTFCSTVRENGAEGTMENYGHTDFIPDDLPQTILAGYYDGNGLVAGDVDLASVNIRAGMNIFGYDGDPNVVDTDESVVYAENLWPLTAGCLLEDMGGFINGELVTGTMSANMNTVFTPSGEVQDIPTGYYEGATVAVAQGVCVSGTATAFAQFSPWNCGVTITGLPFTPKTIFMYREGSPPVCFMYREGLSGYGDVVYPVGAWGDSDGYGAYPAAGGGTFNFPCVNGETVTYYAYS